MNSETVAKYTLEKFIQSGLYFVFVKCFILRYTHTKRKQKQKRNHFCFRSDRSKSNQEATLLLLSLGLHTAGTNLNSPSKAKLLSILLGVNRPLRFECIEVSRASHPQPQKSLLNYLKIDD